MSSGKIFFTFLRRLAVQAPYFAGARALGDCEYQFFSFFSNGCYCSSFSKAIGDLSS